jgi:hypothetical protein
LQTDPTANPGSRRTPQTEEVAAVHRLSMSEALDAVSSIDTTLPENIATPPRSRHSSFATGSFGGARSNSQRTRTKSFLALDDVPSMAEIGVDDQIQRDETEVGSASAKPRRPSQADSGYAGLDPNELKQRRMSNWSTEASSVDTTLLE